MLYVYKWTLTVEYPFCASEGIIITYAEERA